MAEISTAITKFEKEHLGRGPKNVRTFIIEDMILIRITTAEQKLNELTNMVKSEIELKIL